MENKEVNKKEKKASEEIANNIKEHVEDLKEEIQEKTKDIKENLEEKTKELKKDFQEKTKELKSDLKEKTEELKDKAENILKDIKDNSKKFDKKDIEENKAMAALAYIIAPIPYFVETKSKWVHYHAVQGMNLFIIFILLSLIISVLNSLILWPLLFVKTLLRTILYAGATIFAIIGIVNVCNGEAKELPIINKFKIIKK